MLFELALSTDRNDVIMEHLASANYSSAADLATWRLYIQASTFVLKIDHQWGKVHSMCAHHVLSTAKALC